MVPLSQYLRSTLNKHCFAEKKTENYQHNANKQLAATTIPVTDMDLDYKKRLNT